MHKAAEADRQRAALALERSVVRAPINATVLKVNIHVGEYAQPGVLATPLVAIGALDQLHLRVEVDDNDAWRISSAAPAVAMVRGNSSLSTRLKFVRFEPTVVAKHNLTGMEDRVDERVVEVIYSFKPGHMPVRVGQEIDAFIEAPPSNAAESLDPLRSSKSILDERGS